MLETRKNRGSVDGNMDRKRQLDFHAMKNSGADGTVEKLPFHRLLFAISLWLAGGWQASKRDK